MKKFINPWLIAVNCAGILTVASHVSPVSAQTLEGMPYVNSWIGNTYGTPADHIAHSIDTIYVTPSGKVATITGWDEGGANAALYSSTGAKIGIPVENGTGSWGRNSGSAVFVDDTYLYQSMQQQGGYDADGVKYPVDPRRHSRWHPDAELGGRQQFRRRVAIVEAVNSSSKSTIVGLEIKSIERPI